MIRSILVFFDKLEDYIRGHLSRYHIPYTIIGSIAIVLFWRGVWHTADLLKDRGGWLGWLFYEPVNMVIALMVLLATGLFVSYFIGDTILISGLKGEKKVTEHTAKEVREEDERVRQLRDTVREVKKELDEIREAVMEERNEHHPDKK